MQKLLFLALLLVIAFFQYELRYGHGGIHDQELLHNNILKQIRLNQQYQQRNDKVSSHLRELKGSPEFMEARARRELNLIKSDEILVMLPELNSSQPKAQ